MNTLERLKELEAKFPDMNAYDRALTLKLVMRELPKLLAVVEAAREQIDFIQSRSLSWTTFDSKLARALNALDQP